MKKKWSIVTVSVAMFAAAAIAGCGSSKESGGAQTNPPADSQTNPSGNTGQQQEKKEERVLRMMAGVIGGKTPEENVLFEKEIERLTGIKVKLEKPASDYDQKLMAAIGSGEKFDLLQISKERMNQFVAQGILMPLTDKVKNSKVLQDPNVLPPGEWDQVKTKDGQIYGVFTKFQGGTMPIIRNDWLKKLNLQEPKTLDDYYNVLKAFKERDPDGNGKRTRTG